MKDRAVQKAAVVLWGGLFVTGCVPTIGSDLSGQPELGEVPYPDVNTVPFGAEAEASRRWHEGVDAVARNTDERFLETDRQRLEAQGDLLRREAGLPPRES